MQGGINSKYSWEIERKLKKLKKNENDFKKLKKNLKKCKKNLRKI